MILFVLVHFNTIFICSFNICRVPSADDSVMKSPSLLPSRRFLDGGWAECLSTRRAVQGAGEHFGGLSLTWLPSIHRKWFFSQISLFSRIFKCKFWLLSQKFFFLEWWSHSFLKLGATWELFSSRGLPLAFLTAAWAGPVQEGKCVPLRGRFWTV